METIELRKWTTFISIAQIKTIHIHTEIYIHTYTCTTTLVKSSKINTWESQRMQNQSDEVFPGCM